MVVYNVNSEEFKKYGRIIASLQLNEIVKEMEHTPCPEDVVYIPSAPELEQLPIYQELQTMIYGEINIAATDLILLLGIQQDITDTFTYNTSNVEAFLLPANTAVEIYATTLHYAPCSVKGNGFRCVVVLPKDTNLPLDKPHNNSTEDKLLTAKNKWLIAHKESGIEGNVHFGLEGENITI